MSLSPEQLQELIEDLNGSCKTIAECLPTDVTEESLSQDDCAEIDSQIFQCDRCNWWHEISEEAEQSDETQRICEDCA